MAATQFASSHVAICVLSRAIVSLGVVVGKRRFDVLLVREPSPEAGWLENLIRSRRADGYIIIGQSTQHEALNAVAKDFLPFVVGGSPVPGQSYCTVGSDNFAGGRIATEHLIACGRKRIAFLGPAELPQIDKRLEGYKAALEGAGIAVADEFILNAQFTGMSAYDQVHAVIKANLGLDAIFAASDGIAVSAMRALEAAGLRCPQDVAVVGFDDSDLAVQTRPLLTTVRQDIAGMAQMIVESLFKRLDGFDTPSAILPVELVVRGST